MPGVDLNLDIPLLADTMADFLSKTAVALSAIEDDLAGKVTPSEMNINTALDMTGSQLKNVGSVALVSGNVPTAAGSLYYDSGEFYVRDATGVIRLTLAGAIDASSVGGISGMGSTTAAVTYDLASTTFQFTSAPGVWAKLATKAIVLEGANGTVTLGVDNAINSARTLNVKSLPASGVSLLVYNASTSTLEDGHVTATTNSLTGTLTVDGTLVAQEFAFAPGFLATHEIPLDTQSYNQSNVTVTDSKVTATAASWRWESKSLGNWLRSGDRLVQVTFHFTVKPAAGGTVSIFRYDCDAGTTATLQTFADASTGAHSISGLLTTPMVMDVGHQLFVQYQGTSGSSGDVLSRVYITYDHPA